MERLSSEFSFDTDPGRWISWSFFLVLLLGFLGLRWWHTQSSSFPRFAEPRSIPVPLNSLSVSSVGALGLDLWPGWMNSPSSPFLFGCFYHWKKPSSVPFTPAPFFYVVLLVLCYNYLLLHPKCVFRPRKSYVFSSSYLLLHPKWSTPHDGHVCVVWGYIITHSKGWSRWWWKEGIRRYVHLFQVHIHNYYVSVSLDMEVPLLLDINAVQKHLVPSRQRWGACRRAPSKRKKMGQLPVLTRMHIFWR